MKIVVIGGTGLIGSKLVQKLTEHCHEAVPAAPNAGLQPRHETKAIDPRQDAGLCHS